MINGSELEIFGKRSIVSESMAISGNAWRTPPQRDFRRTQLPKSFQDLRCTMRITPWRDVRGAADPRNATDPIFELPIVGD